MGKSEEGACQMINSHLSIEELETAYHTLSIAYRELAKENEELKRDNINLKRLIEKDDGQ